MKEKKIGKNKNETSISIRTTKIRKEEVRSILAVLNDKREPNERKKTDKYLEEYFIESYKQNPEFFSVKVELIDERKKLRRINEKIEDLEYIKSKAEEKINRLESILANDSLDNYSEENSEEILKTGLLEKAFNHLLAVCKDRHIESIEQIPSELYTASLNVVEGKVRKTNLIRLVKQEFKKNPNLFIAFEKSE